MDISIGSYKVSIEMLLLIVVMLWIIFGHALCSCSTVSAMEGFEMAKGMMTTSVKEGLPPKPPMPRAPAKKLKAEGFTNNSSGAFDTQFATTNSADYYMPPNEWAQQSLVYTPGQKPPPGVKAIWDRTKNQPPRKPGQLSFFDNVLFKPECCTGSDSSSSMGCACYTVEDYKYLVDRGGNNVPFSEY
jgi:hypothetical protein